MVTLEAQAPLTPATVRSQLREHAEANAKKRKRLELLISRCNRRTILPLPVEAEAAK